MIFSLEFLTVATEIYYNMRYCWKCDSRHEGRTGSKCTEAGGSEGADPENPTGLQSLGAKVAKLVKVKAQLVKSNAGKHRKHKRRSGKKKSKKGKKKSKRLDEFTDSDDSEDSDSDSESESESDSDSSSDSSSS